MSKTTQEGLTTNYPWINPGAILEAVEYYNSLSTNEQDQIDHIHEKACLNMFNTYTVRLDYVGANNKAYERLKDDYNKRPTNLISVIRVFMNEISRYQRRRQYAELNTADWIEDEGATITWMFLGAICDHNVYSIHPFELNLTDDHISILFSHKDFIPEDTKQALWASFQSNPVFGFLSRLLGLGRFYFRSDANPILFYPEESCSLLIMGTGNRQTPKALIVDLLREIGPMTRTELVRTTEMTDRIVAYALAGLLKDNRVEMNGKEGSPKTLYLVVEPKEPDGLN